MKAESQMVAAPILSGTKRWAQHPSQTRTLAGWAWRTSYVDSEKAVCCSYLLQRGAIECELARLSLSRKWE